MTRLAATVIRKPVMGPRELFYADLFASRETGCWGRLGMPGLRDQHTGCVGAYLVEHDLYDFLLLQPARQRHHSHIHGPAARRSTRSPRPTASSSASRMPRAGWTGSWTSTR